MSGGELLLLVEQQQALLADLVAGRERDQAEIAWLRAAHERAPAEIAELRAEREVAQAALAEVRAANEQLRTRVLALEGALATLQQGGPRGMPGLKPAEPVAPAAEQPRKHRERGAGRARSVPTRSVVQAAERCPACGTELRVGAIVAASHQVAQRGASEVAHTRERVRASPLVQADETGWRQHGKNGYRWTFSTPTERDFVSGGRDKEMVDQVLGDTCAGVLVSDCYQAYDHVRTSKQRCWAHLLRDAHDLRKQCPTDARGQTWVDDLHRLDRDAVAVVATAPTDLLARAAAAGGFAAPLLALAQPWLADATAPQHTLSKRIAQDLGERLTVVREPDVPPDINAAERSLRHLVTSRKLSGGSRSADGTATKMARATRFGTWRARDTNPFLACRQLLSPQV